MPITELETEMLRLLDENAEFLALVRSKILTDELINLPEEFAKFVAATNRRFDALEERVAALVLNAEATNRRLDAMDKRMDGMNERMDGMNERMDGMDNSIKRLADSQGRMHQSLDRFRGNYAAEGAWNNRRTLATLIADATKLGRPRLKTFSDEELDDMLDNNFAVIDVLEEEGDVLARFGEADLIALAERRLTREPLFWIVVEASYTVDADDVIRASDNAKFLRAATGQNAYGIVVGVHLDPQIEERYEERIVYDMTQYIESDSEDIVYWFELTETSAQPRSPR